MANRLVSNMYIIDSHQVATPLSYGLTAGNSTPILNAFATTANVGKMRLQSIIFMATTTAAQVKIAVGNTNNIIFDYTLIKANTIPGETYQRTKVDIMGYGVPLQGVFIPVITACTAVLVLG